MRSVFPEPPPPPAQDVLGLVREVLATLLVTSSKKWDAVLEDALLRAVGFGVRLTPAPGLPDVLPPDPDAPPVQAPDYTPGAVPDDALTHLALEESRQRAEQSGRPMSEEDHWFMSRWYRPFLLRAAAYGAKQAHRDMIARMAEHGLLAGVLPDLDVLGEALGLPKGATPEQMQVRARELVAAVAAVRAALPADPRT